MARPRSFDEDLVLDAALHVFWKKGYEGASLKDLTHAMGINAPSLYAAFGDKQTLFLKSIERYNSAYACHQYEAFMSETSIEHAVKAFMIKTIELVTDNGCEARGCFLASVVVSNALEVEGVEAILQSVIFNSQKNLAERFDEEKVKGNLPQNFPSLIRAKLMYDFSLGHAYRARVGLSKASLLEDLEFQVKGILAI